jgi:hypothetical protein
MAEEKVVATTLPAAQSKRRSGVPGQPVGNFEVWKQRQS